MSDRGNPVPTDSSRPSQAPYLQAWIGALTAAGSAGMGLSHAIDHDLTLLLEVPAAIICIGVGAGIGAGVGMGLAMGLSEAIHHALARLLRVPVDPGATD